MAGPPPGPGRAEAGGEGAAFGVAGLDDDGAPSWARGLRSGAADRARALTADDAPGRTGAPATAGAPVKEMLMASNKSLSIARKSVV